MKSISKLITLIALLLCWTTNVQANTINISVAASMTDAFKEIIAAYSAIHPKTKILANFGSSGSLAKQIIQGAPADLYVSANPKWADHLIENKATTASKTRVLAYNKLVFIGKSSVTATRIDQLVSLEKISIGSPQSVPAGQYAKQAMTKAGVYSSLKKQGKLVMAKDVRQALLYADRGEVDGAFVYKTDALLAKEAKILFTVPENSYDKVSYLFAVTVSGEKNKAAVDFYNYLSSEQSSAIIKSYGFEPATGK